MTYVDRTRPPGSTELLERALRAMPLSHFIRDVCRRHARTSRLTHAQVEAIERTLGGVRAHDTNKQTELLRSAIDDWLATMRLTRKDVEELAEARKRTSAPAGSNRFANIIPVESVGMAGSIEELRRRRAARGDMPVPYSPNGEAAVESVSRKAKEDPT